MLERMHAAASGSYSNRCFWRSARWSTAHGVAKWKMKCPMLLMKEDNALLLLDCCCCWCGGLLHVLKEEVHVLFCFCLFVCMAGSWRGHGGWARRSYLTVEAGTYSQRGNDDDIQSKDEVTNAHNSSDDDDAKAYN